MIAGIPITDVGAGALVIFIVILILTDRLVPRRRLDVLEKRIEVLDETNHHLAKQNETLLNSVAPTVNGVLGALHQGLIEDRESR